MQRTPAATPGGDGPPPESGHPPRRRRRPTTVVDMVLSLAAIFAFVAVVLLLVPQSAPIEQPAIDRADAAAAAGAAAAELGFEPVVPAVGDGWEVAYARVELATGAVRQWRVGYRSPAGDRVDLEQTAEATEDWLLRPDEGDEADDDPGGPEVLSPPPGWRPVVRGDGDLAYVSQAPAAGSGGTTVTTVVSAGTEWQLAAAVAEAVATAPQTGG